MRRHGFAILGVVMLALISVACGESDLGITTKVKSRLDTERAINASQIQVSTQNKVVTLSGPVDSPASKERAVAVARRVESVMDVVDNLSVSTAVAAMPGAAAGTASAPSDGAITVAVKDKLQSQPETAAEKVTVNTEAGVVILTGTVKTPETKDEVIRIARNTEGVQRVEDHLTVGTS
jgi:osmotically-inducible protein OsmY